MWFHSKIVPMLVHTCVYKRQILQELLCLLWSDNHQNMSLPTVICVCHGGLPPSSISLSSPCAGAQCIWKISVLLRATFSQPKYILLWCYLFTKQVRNTSVLGFLRWLLQVLSPSIKCVHLLATGTICHMCLINLTFRKHHIWPQFLHFTDIHTLKEFHWRSPRWAKLKVWWTHHLM